jgi:hypothetical protein
VVNVEHVLRTGCVRHREAVLLWPQDIGERLDDDVQLEAILAHELCHVRRTRRSSQIHGCALGGSCGLLLDVFDEPVKSTGEPTWRPNLR